jgi:molecular chaperone DnaK
MSKIIGIDLGTTNSVVAVMQGGEPVVIPNQEGGADDSVRGRPSPRAASGLVGQVAKRQAITNPENTVYSIKRFMGRRYDEVTEEAKRVPYKVTKGPHDDARVEISGKAYSPPEISAMILQKAEDRGGGFSGREGHQGGDHRAGVFQRQPAAGHQAGRRNRRPGSAAHHQRADGGRARVRLDKKKDETIAVYDLGGGTFDISILEVGEGVVEVKSTNGDTHLGGDDIDQKIVEWMVAEFKRIRASTSAKTAWPSSG